MRTLEKYLIALYFAVCPIELALHLLLPSTVKYLGLMIVLVQAGLFLSRGREAALRLSPAGLALSLWLCLCVISLSWGGVHARTKEYLTTDLMMGGLVLLCTQEAWDERDIALFLRACLAGSVFMAAAVLSFRGGKFSDRETIVLWGRAADPNQTAAYIAPGALLSLQLMVDPGQGKGVRGLGAAGFILCVYAIFLTGSRGGFVALAAGIGALIFCSARQGRLQAAAILPAALVLAAALLLPAQRWRVLDFASYTETYANHLNRGALWRALLRSFDVDWLWGHGVGSTVDYFQGVLGKAAAVHNTYLQVLYEVGIGGFCLFLFPLVSMLFACRRRGALLSLLVAAALCSAFLDALNLRYLWNALLLCMMQSALDSPRQEAPCPCRYIRRE